MKIGSVSVGGTIKTSSSHSSDYHGSLCRKLLLVRFNCVVYQYEKIEWKDMCATKIKVEPLLKGKTTFPEYHILSLASESLAYSTVMDWPSN